jgi:hypothetical protein
MSKIVIVLLIRHRHNPVDLNYIFLKTGNLSNEVVS